MYTRRWQWRHAPVAPRDYVVLLTLLRLRGLRDAPPFGWEVWRVLGALRHSPGLVGYSVAGNVRDQEYYTLSVWDSEAALEAFVQGPVHRHAMTALRDRLAATRFVRWTMPGLRFRLDGPRRSLISARRPDGSARRGESHDVGDGVGGGDWAMMRVRPGGRIRPHEIICEAEEDLPLYDWAQALVGDNVSAAVTCGPRRFVGMEDNHRNGYHEVTVRVHTGYGLRTQRFGSPARGMAASLRIRACGSVSCPSHAQGTICGLRATHW